MSENNKPNNDSNLEVNPVAIINDLARQLKDEKGFSKELQLRNRFLYIVLGVLVVLVAMSGSRLFTAKDYYFSVDQSGNVNQLVDHVEPHVDRIRRMQLAEFIVRTLNSLDFVNRDKLLDEVDHYFVDSIYQDYLEQQSKNFDLMDEYNIKYVASIDPPRLIANSDRGISPEQKECYQTKKLKGGGTKEVSCNDNNLDYEGISETYEFPVKRDRYANAKKTDSQIFKVRLTLERSKDGIRVSHYKEEV